MKKKIKESKIPDYTPELESKIELNAESLISIGLKGWKRMRKNKGANTTEMSELEQNETLRRLEEINLEGKEFE